METPYDKLFDKLGAERYFDRDAFARLIKGYERFDKFYEEHCKDCKSKQCMGVYDRFWRGECQFYKEEIINNDEGNN